MLTSSNAYLKSYNRQSKLVKWLPIGLISEFVEQIRCKGLTRNSRYAFTFGYDFNAIDDVILYGLSNCCARRGRGTHFLRAPHYDTALSIAGIVAYRGSHQGRHCRRSGSNLVTTNDVARFSSVHCVRSNDETSALLCD